MKSSSLCKNTSIFKKECWMVFHSSVIAKSFLLSVIFSFMVSEVSANEPEKMIMSMTLLEEWAPNTKLEKKVETSRRQWLASLRSKRKVIDVDEDEILMEELDAPNGIENGPVSKGLLEEFVEIIKLENDNPS